MRGRGLKHESITSIQNQIKVAPHAGAWIETHHETTHYKSNYVAPHAGAWIETPI